jgi:beta-alanine degradation protein BauB
MSYQVSNGPLGDIATKLLHEDDRVRIWELRLEPGQESDAHRHALDHILVIIEGDKIAAVPHVSSTGPSATYIEANVEPGQFFIQERGGTEVARNTGSKLFRELLIELKDR